MVEFIYLTCAAGCGYSMTIVMPQGGVRWSVPADVCLENQSDNVGYASIDYSDGKVKVRLTPNLKPCKSEEDCAPKVS